MAKKDDVKVEASEPVKAEVKPEPKIEFKQVNLGVSTINDHEQRITVLEAEMAKLNAKN